MNLRDWMLRLRALVRPRRTERDLAEELSFHIEREASHLITQGLSPKDAWAKARANFGSATVAADACRDERGTAFIDGTLADLRYAFRTFRRAPLPALTVVGTVALGLGAVAVVFTGLNALLWSADRVPRVTDMYAVARTGQAPGAPAAFTRRYVEALRAETTVFAGAYATVTGIDLRIDGRIMAVSLVSADFFHVVDVHPRVGRGFTGADDERGGGNRVVVLSDQGWQRHFNREPAALGRTVLVGGEPYTIVGIMPEGFRGLEVSAPDLWAPLARVADFEPAARGAEERVGVTVVGRVAPGVTREQAEAQLAAWHAHTSAASGPPVRVTLLPHQGTMPEQLEALAVSAPLFVAFGLILLIGCANVANLLLARGVARQRELGIRLSIGASRRRIVRQLLTESMVLALAAAAGGYVVSRLALTGMVAWALRTVPRDLGNVNLSVPAADWRVVVFLVVGAVVATALFALVPALQATRIEPVRTLRGEVVRDARPGRARNLLIGLQVFASALLLICSAIFLRSALASSQFDPGFRTADTLLIDVTNDHTRDAVLRAIERDPAVSGFAAMQPPLLAMPPRALGDAGAGKVPVSYRHVSAQYFDVLGVPIVRGRAFTASEREESAVAIVSESTAQALWPGRDGVGQTFTIEPDAVAEQRSAFLTINPGAGDGQPALTPRTVRVVGIAKDVAGFRVTDVKEAGVFLPPPHGQPDTFLVARVRGEVDQARQSLLETLTQVDPNMGQILTMRTVARLETFFLNVAFSVSVVLGGLALLLTVSGLFSVLSYLVEQRTREVAVRIALGASTRNVTGLMVGQTGWPVALGLVGGAGLAAALASLVLATEAGALIAGIVQVADPVAYLASVGLIVVACALAAWIPARRAAVVDPMQALRRD